MSKQNRQQGLGARADLAQRIMQLERFAQMLGEQVNHLRAIAEQSMTLASDAIGRLDGVHNQWVTTVKLLGEKGVATEDDFQDAYMRHVVEPEKERQRRIMESHNTRHEDGTGCPIRCNMRQDPPDKGEFDPRKCQYLWESCPAGFNPNASKIVQQSAARVPVEEEEKPRIIEV